MSSRGRHKLAFEIGQSKACNELNLLENMIYGWMHLYRQVKLDLGSGMQTLAMTLTMNEERIEASKAVEEADERKQRAKEGLINSYHDVVQFSQTFENQDFYNHPYI